MSAKEWGARFAAQSLHFDDLSYKEAKRLQTVRRQTVRLALPSQGVRLPLSAVRCPRLISLLAFGAGCAPSVHCAAKAALLSLRFTRPFSKGQRFWGLV